jgi:uncharacterized membrane protein YdjX (TVP38/TMEM64 family)
MNWFRRLGPVGPLATLAIVIPPISGILLIGTVHQVGPWLKSHEVVGLLMYVTGFALLGGLALLPTYAQSLLGGWAFGMAAGFCAAIAGFGGAALVGYAVARRVAGTRIEDLIAEHRRWSALHRALLGSGFWKAFTLVTLVRLPPNSPFAASNVAMAALGVPRIPFALGTVVGLAPRTAIVVYAGAGLSTLDFANPQQAGWFLGSLLVTLLVVVAVGWMANRALRRVEMQHRDAAPVV